ncbi:hypothetical protein K523DRAFT_73052 [Schizophyllum commune Tattone D]|nr:hypothetical protein K523DRAFT_73052 [Schizophyllum commune Tattone D]
MGVCAMSERVYDRRKYERVGVGINRRMHYITTCCGAHFPWPTPRIRCGHWSGSCEKDKRTTETATEKTDAARWG